MNLGTPFFTPTDRQADQLITYEKLNRNPPACRSIAGVDIAEFETLYQEFVPVWTESEQKRLSRANRQRAIGGGHQYKLELRERLLMTLVWLHLCLSMETLGFLFGVDKSTASRNTRRTLPVLRQLGDTPHRWPAPPKRGEGKSIKQALRDCPDLLALIDATTQAAQRSETNHQPKPITLARTRGIYTRGNS